ncbi:MAG: bactofilin family protein [Kiloniellales bacterium]
MAPDNRNILAPVASRSEPLPPTSPAIGRAASATVRTQSPRDEAAGRLIVGPGIEIAGDIEACRILVVEGRVDASLPAEALEIKDGGSFSGQARVERAEIAGSFDGELLVRGSLLIRSSGRVSGRVRYNRVVIEDGGVIAGDISQGEASASDRRSGRAD